MSRLVEGVEMTNGQILYPHGYKLGGISWLGRYPPRSRSPSLTLDCTAQTTSARMRFPQYLTVKISRGLYADKMEDC